MDVRKMISPNKRFMPLPIERKIKVLKFVNIEEPPFR
jgi:hypothetical protein